MMDGKGEGKPGCSDVFSHYFIPMASDTQKQDRLLGMAFAIGLVLLILPDIFFHDGSIQSLPVWLTTTITFSDAALFTLVFIFLKIEIRKRRGVNKQLTIANQLKSEFLQIAAHDLRNPLNSILLSASQLPPQKDATTGEVYDPGKEIRTTAAEMRDIITGLLDAAAMEDSSFTLHRKPLKLAECVGEMVERNRLLAEHKNQQIRFLATTDCVLELDQGRIKQAVDNLISNAIKFSPWGESITVTVQQVDDQARIEVTDRGPGLTDSDKERVFGRFQRLSARPTGGEPSVGLGLANAQRLVELHGGKIGAESEGPGQGSLFWIELPLIQR